jgi:predicted RNase H-like nuclease (RuvC/YqgF family)
LERYTTLTTKPNLYHLAVLEEQYPRYAAVLTDMNAARIFVFGLGHGLDVEEVKGKKVHRVKVGGWSQARYQRRVGIYTRSTPKIIRACLPSLRDSGSI